MSTQKVFINWILVYLLVFLSGSWRYNMAGNKYLVLGFLVSVTAWFLFTDRKISDRFILYAVIFASLLFSLSLYTGGGITVSSMVSGLMKLIIGYLILKTVGASFSDTYIKLIVLLAVVSLFGYMTDRLNLFDGLVRKLPPVDEFGYEGIFYLYRFSWHNDRNNSIFYEPGAYQAFLNAALFLLVFTKTSFENRKKWIYIAIIVTTLITTFSTTGFLIFAIMLVLLFYKSDILTFSGKIGIIGIAFAVVAVFSAQFHSTFVVKLNDYLTAEEGELGTSASDRKTDSRNDLKIFRKHVFGLGFDKYKQEFDSLRGTVLPGEASNGITYTLAVLGLPFSLFLFGSFYWALKKLLGNFLLATVAFVMFMLFLAGQAYYVVTPISMAIIAAAFVFDYGSVKRESQRDTGELPNPRQSGP